MGVVVLLFVYSSTIENVPEIEFGTPVTLSLFAALVVKSAVVWLPALVLVVHVPEETYLM